eukprot:7088334-Prorocentrum_lima.AAC.1
MEKLVERRAALRAELEETKLQEAALEREAVTLTPPPSTLSNDNVKDILAKALGALQAVSTAGGSDETKRRKVTTDATDAKMDDSGGTAAAATPSGSS